MTMLPNNFSKWPSFVQRAWLKANPGVVRDHRDNHRVTIRPGLIGNARGHRHINQRPHCHGHHYDRHEQYGNNDPGFSTRDRRGGFPSDNSFQRMLDSGDIEGLLNRPGAGEWLKNPENNLKVMMAIQNENRLFSLLSNVIKTAHDTKKAVINNMRA